MAVVDFLESISLSKHCSNTSIPMHTNNTPPLLPYFLFQPLKFSEIKARDLSNKEHFSVLTINISYIFLTLHQFFFKKIQHPFSSCPLSLPKFLNHYTEYEHEILNFSIIPISSPRNPPPYPARCKRLHIEARQSRGREGRTYI